MLSRVADSIYWMCRYIERAENIARFMDVSLHLVLDLPVGAEGQWKSLVAATGDDETFAQRHGEATQQKVIDFLTFDADNPNSIYSCLWSARENARSVREVISSEMWEQVNRSFLMVRDARATGRVQADPAGFFSHLKKACHLFLGIADATMTHGEGWNFGRVGRLLERADKTSRLLDVKYFILLPTVDYVGSPYDNVQWIAVLKSASAFEMYRKQYHQITPRGVAEYLILDAQFPRAIHWCLIKAEESLHAISGSPITTFTNAAEKKMGRLGAEMDYISIDEILSQGLHEYLDDLQGKLNEIGDAIFETFFAVRAI